MKRITAIFMAMLMVVGIAYADRINLNTATKDELMTLNGIGDAKAEAIMKYRKTHTFGSAEDIKDVPGIGEGIYNKNKKVLRTRGTTTTTASESMKKSAKTQKDKVSEDAEETTKKAKRKSKKKAKKAKKEKDKAKKKAKKKEEEQKKEQ
jgi:competence protein ComEA